MTQSLKLSQLGSSRVSQPGSGTARSHASADSMTKSYTVCMDAVEKSRNSPGVGAYDVNRSNIKKDAGFTFGLGYKKDKVQTSAGPGSYNIDAGALNYSTGSSFPRSARSTSAQSNTPDCVGPASYNVMRRSGSSGFSLGQRTKQANNEKNPGVGAYDIAGRLSEKGAGAMGGRYAHFMNMYDVGNKSPSVGTYDIDLENKTRKGKGFSFGKEVKRVDYNNYPGVGSYNIDRKRSGSGSTFGSRTKVCLK